MNNLESITLDNGLRIYTYVDKRRHSTFFDYITLAGGLKKDFFLDGMEYHQHDGIAHILEHYIVECNENGNFLKFLGSKQMNTNASTGKDATEYYFETVENLNLGIHSIIEAVNNVKFTEEKLNKLKNPIIQEIRGKMDNKFYHANKLIMENSFHKIKFNDVGGTPDEIKDTKVSEIEAFYNAFYNPKNQVIVVAGSFNKEEVINEIKSIFKKINKEKHKTEIINIDETDTVNKKEDILFFKTPREYKEVIFKINCTKFSNKELLDLDFYSNCFFNNFFGITSKFYNKLINEKIITDVMNCGIRKINNYALVSIGNYTTNGDYLVKSILEEIKKMNSFNKINYELDKKSCILSLILREENIYKMITPFISNIINFNYPYLDKVEDIYNLNFDDYVKAIKKIDLSNYTIITIKEKNQ